MRTISAKMTALSIIPLALSACAGAGRESKVAPTCNETIGLAAKLSDLKVGDQRVQFSVFPQQAAIGEAPHGPDPLLRVRFFRVIEQSPELTQPGQELRLYTPEVPPVAHSKLAPLPTPFGVAQDVHGYEASVAFDKPGAWGVEVFVRTTWQIAPAMTTLMFQVAPVATSPVSAADQGHRDRIVYFGRCGGMRLAPSG